MTILPTIINSVLLVIDTQVGFVSPASAQTVPIIADLLARWQGAGGATVMTRFVNSEDSPYVRIIGWRALMPGSVDVEFTAEVAPYAASASLVVWKDGYTALVPAVREFISETGRENVWMCGLDTESCVLATSFSVFESGLTPWIITDACASHAGGQVHEAGLLVADRNIGAGQLVTTAEVPAQVRAWRPSKVLRE